MDLDNCVMTDYKFAWIHNETEIANECRGEQNVDEKVSDNQESWYD